MPIANLPAAMFPILRVARLRPVVRRTQMFHTKSHLFSSANKSQGATVIDEIKARRAKAGKLVAGVAAASDSDMFKGSVSCLN